VWSCIVIDQSSVRSGLWSGVDVEAAGGVAFVPGLGSRVSSDEAELGVGEDGVAAEGVGRATGVGPVPAGVPGVTEDVVASMPEDGVGRVAGVDPALAEAGDEAGVGEVAGRAPAVP
jgi:hypothetical protein